MARVGPGRDGTLGTDGRVITEVLDPTWMLPAVGQGALGLECRTDDSQTRNALTGWTTSGLRRGVEAERALLFHLGGGCQVPLGASAQVNGETVTLRAAVLAADGSRRIAGLESGPAMVPDAIGERLADRLRGLGAAELIFGSP